MTYLDDLEREPWRHDFLDAMRRFERALGQKPAGRPQEGPKPRVGDSASRRDETVEIGGKAFPVSVGQDPWMDFPASNVSRARVERERVGMDSLLDEPTRNRIQIFTKFLGLLGPQGALPLSMTEEAYGFQIMNDEALPRFLDIFNQRYLQLFFRAWADARPIAQNDRPEFDRFKDYVGSPIGPGSQPYRGLDTVPDAAKLMFAGLLAPKAKSASRLRGALRHLFKVEVEVEQFVGVWLAFDEGERSKLGAKNSGLGTDFVVGAASYSVQDKFRLRIYVADLKEYARFLPKGSAIEPLVDLVFFYVGAELDWDVELALPVREVVPVKLGQTGQLGWTTWMSPNYGDGPGHRCDARFHPADLVARQRASA